MRTISAQEIKRRGISAVDDLLVEGPVHVITRNEPRYVVMDECRYQGTRRSVSRGICGARARGNGICGAR